MATQHRFSTYYINCHQLIEQLKKAHFENRLPDKLKVLAKCRMLIIDEIGYLPSHFLSLFLHFVVFQLLCRGLTQLFSGLTDTLVQIRGKLRI